ncbi:hypothetical protein ONZ45_g853 [Pleurotus djamor]|nr:hypothetical protein ONZ45_g853 [Pleurotus djamor]
MPEPSFGLPPAEPEFNFDYLHQQQPQPLFQNQGGAGPGYPVHLGNLLNQPPPPLYPPAQYPQQPQLDQPFVSQGLDYPQQPLPQQGLPFPPQQIPQLVPRQQPLTIKLPPTGQMVATRSGGRKNSLTSAPSGSEYQQSEKSFDHDDKDADGEVEDNAEEFDIRYTQTSRGRRVAMKVYKESGSEGYPEEDGDGEEEEAPVKKSTKSRRLRSYRVNDEDDDEDADGDSEQQRPYSTRRTSTRAKSRIQEEEDSRPQRYPSRNRSKPKPSLPTRGSSRLSSRAPPKVMDTKSLRNARYAKRNAAKDPGDGDEAYVQNTSSAESVSEEGSLAEAARTSSEPEPEPEPEDVHDNDLDNGDAVEVVESDGKPYALRQRAKVNYAIPPPLEEMVRKAEPKGRNGFGGNYRKPGARKPKGLGWSASGAELGRLMGIPGDDSDSDFPTRTPRKSTVAAGLLGTINGSSGGMDVLPAGDLAAAAGTPSNLGKVRSDSALADADPLGPSQNVTFEDVGGLDEHIHSLKEMTLLPLLYPEVFQNFGITPPRGVLFHGPPGTGKTLLARALAASCRSNGQGISFYMRKGADCLSKWVGEAERQLRLLFDEARNTQPSIIFFDEIDGLAPVRSSKQDQIHASIVSTLLALMDGMDGRGQVVVIGATNRPDAVDPALRRPGRFDREFYFGLPGLEAREKILGVMTKQWKGWGASSTKGKEKASTPEVNLIEPAGAQVEEQVEDQPSQLVKDKLHGLAKLTKGYGGADLRALCTEAALNAVQRRYPQIYKSTDRLLLSPESIEIQLRDFMISIKKLVPSSARSSASAAVPLPPQFVPLLSDHLEKVKEVINRVLPVSKRRTALEEAEFEDEGEEGALDREMTLQSMEKLRIYRPRVVIHGDLGMGQGYIGAGALHHLEGFNIQSLELGTLMSDSTRTVEAAIVQLFVEAKRTQPSIVYIPSLLGWCAATTDTARSTVRAMLDTLAPTDPILLLAVVDGPFSSLPSDVKAWFGPTRDNRIQLTSPTFSQRSAFFSGLIHDIKRPPNLFPDGIKRRKRVLEELPIAPPLEPRKPTAAELAVQAESDQKQITFLKHRLGAILAELKRKFKRFAKRATQEYNFDVEPPVFAVAAPPVEVVIPEAPPHEPNAMDVVEVDNNMPDQAVPETQVTEPLINGHIDPIPDDPFAPQQQEQAQLVPLFDMDLERMQTDLWKEKYLTGQDFLDDLGKIVHNATVRSHEDLDRMAKAQSMYVAAQVSIQDFEPHFRLECERTAVRERQRREERRKLKEMNKASNDGVPPTLNGVGHNGPLTRRSARANGQQPEISITDPVKLERKLKRQRTDGASGHDTNGSEEEGSERAMKRSKTADEEDRDKDPLDCLAEREPATAVDGVGIPQPVVHFADGIRTAPSTPPPPPPAAASSSQPPATANTDDMVVDAAPTVSHGFDPMLLNPAPVNPTVASPSMTPSPIVDDSTPPVPPPPAAPKSPSPIIVERTPSPPLPDFTIDHAALSSFEQELCTKTTALNIEQLEQLRAMCLSCVWRHRMEWDRGSLINELSTLVQGFVEEIEEFLDTSD